MNKRILLSFGMLAFVGAVVAGGTGAFFSDTETSTGNVFTAGSVSIDLLDVEHDYYGNDNNAPVFDWMGEQGRFTLDDLKPLDTGMLDLDLVNGANEAHVCAMITGNPGDLVDANDIALYDQLNFFQDDGTQVVPGTWFDLGIANPNGPVGTGVDYCFGEANVDGTGLVSCDYGDGSIVYNDAQNGSFAADLMFYAIQTRNNESFSCDQLTLDGNNEPVYTPEVRPLIGADLDAYVAPTTADFTVLTGQSIQATIDGAVEGQTILVEPGTYAPFVVDKGLTIAAATGPDSGTPVTVVPVDATYSQLAEVTADNVTITGFVFDGQNTPSTGNRTAGINVETSTGNPDLSNIEVSYNRIVNINSVTTSGQTGSYALKLFSENGRSMTNVLLAHNEINGVNNLAGGGYGIQSVGELNNATIEYNTITDINSGGWKLGLAIDAKVTETNTDVDISRNVVLSGADADVQIERLASAGTVTLNENNLTSMIHGGGNPFVAGTGTVNAENNWWGDTDPSDNIGGPIDADPFEASAFPTN